jgi:phage terminase small subunit
MSEELNRVEENADQEWNSPYAEDLDKIINNNPQKKLFWELYFNPESPCFGNATESALKAGWTDSGAKEVTRQRWFKSGLKRTDMADQAEVVLHDSLKMTTMATKMVGGVEVVVEDPQLIKIKQDTAKYVTGTLLKNVYSTKTESETKHSGEINLKKEISDEEFDKILGNYAKRKSTNKKSGSS